MNKKGQIVEVWILLFTMASVGFALFTVITNTNEIVSEVSSPLELLDVQQDARNDLFLLEESAKFSIHQASWAILKSAQSQEGCELFEDNLIWTEDCKPDLQDLESKFLEEFQSEFFSSTGEVREDYSIVLNERLEATSDKRKEYSYLNTAIKVDKSFSLDIPFPLSEIEKMYIESKAAVSSCKDEEKIEECVLDKVMVENFDIVPVTGENFLIFNAKTKEKLFFNDGELKFNELALNYAFPLD